MHDARTRTRPPESMPRASAFDPMASSAVVEAGKRLVGGRLTPREFDAVVEHERAAWERRQAGGLGPSPRTAPVAAAFMRR